MNKKDTRNVNWKKDESKTEKDEQREIVNVLGL